MFRGGPGVVFGFCVGRERNGYVNLIRVSRVCSKVMKTERIASDMILTRVEDVDPAEIWRPMRLERSVFRRHEHGESSPTTCQSWRNDLKTKVKIESRSERPM